VTDLDILLAGAHVGPAESEWARTAPEVVAINHAARKVGAVCVPMNYRLAPDEAAHVVDNCDAVVILFDVEQASQLEPILEQCDRVRSWLSFRNQGRAVPSWARDLDAEAQEASTDEPTCTPSSRPTRATRWIPRTASGKILKRQLREPYWAGRTAKIG
jgi:acyl-CoA synthetase (AMP-forming)/AMP-acid ligase II